MPRHGRCCHHNSHVTCLTPRHILSIRNPSAPNPIYTPPHPHQIPTPSPHQPRPIRIPNPPHPVPATSRSQPGPIGFFWLGASGDHCGTYLFPGVCAGEVSMHTSTYPHLSSLSLHRSATAFSGLHPDACVRLRSTFQDGALLANNPAAIALHEVGTARLDLSLPSHPSPPHQPHTSLQATGASALPRPPYRLRSFIRCVKPALSTIGLAQPLHMRAGTGVRSASETVKSAMAPSWFNMMQTVVRAATRTEEVASCCGLLEPWSSCVLLSLLSPCNVPVTHLSASLSFCPRVDSLLLTVSAGTLPSGRHSPRMRHPLFPLSAATARQNGY